ncbi:hypothetical protein IT402_01950 [Candidatus Nomurabacteria bacterium]|nr:hypothetical protein [Candidatus Nomurabacteria bacterium]
MKKIIGALAIAAIVGTGAYSVSAATSEKASMRAQLTDAQKQILEQIKTLRSEGKDIEAAALAEANGLDKGFKRRPKATDAEIASMKAIRSAIEAGDYNAFVSAIAGTPAEGKVDQTTFSELVNIHNLRKQAEDASKTFADKHQDLMMLVGPHGH